jgi:transcriptional regulator of acetoin/glycerol metabolism
MVSAADVQFSSVGRLPDAHAAPNPLVSLASAERAHILRVLEATGWNKKAAATVLEIGRATLYRKIAEYGLDRVAGPERRDG